MLACAWLAAACSADPTAPSGPAAPEQALPRDAGLPGDDAGADPPEPSIIHVVAEGQTLWDIARAYDLRVVDLLNANGMNDDESRRLGVGRGLVIPGATEAIEVPGSPGSPQTEDAAAPTPQTGNGIRHRLAHGETIWDMARLFGVSMAELMAANGLTGEAASSLREGAEIFVPGVERDIEGGIGRRPQARLTAAQRRAAARAERLGLGTRKAASMLMTGTVEESWIRAAGGRSGRMPGRLKWPVTKGWFVRGFGSGKSGYHLAVDIAGEIGWNVRASAAGIVGYAGDGVKGYGNMVMVVHQGGWVTMYAHNSVNFVVAGQAVRRGEILAELGSTGISKGPHVHFEFIYKGQNCDPAVLFSPGIRHRDGHLTPIKYASWTVPSARPKWVTCGKRRSYPHGAEPGAESSEPSGE
jgi:murein DD-endopeptidase MepM/ murein hydrolase activator NlpD